jgi:hypothetical protein
MMKALGLDLYDTEYRDNLLNRVTPNQDYIDKIENDFYNPIKFRISLGATLPQIFDYLFLNCNDLFEYSIGCALAGRIFYILDQDKRED